MESYHTHQVAESMPSGWDPKLQTAESRKILVEYAQKHGIKPAMRHFNCSRNTIRKWLRRFEEEGELGLKGKPRGRKPKPRLVADGQKGAARKPTFPWPGQEQHALSTPKQQAMTVRPQHEIRQF